MTASGDSFPDSIGSFNATISQDSIMFTELSDPAIKEILRRHLCRILFSLAVFYSTFSAAQGLYPYYDKVWLMGYDSYGTSTTWGGTRIDFSTNPPTITREDRQMNFEGADASMSDPVGNLIFYTNAYYIANAQNDTMIGGARINPDPTALQDRITQGILVLPAPGIDSEYYILHEMSTFDPTPYSFVQIYRCLYSLIDMCGDNGLGEVIQANRVLFKDTLCYGKLTACKHANGRDWWILIPKWNSAVYFTFLLTPKGFEYYGQQTIGEVPISNLGQAVFSPDGTKYVKYNSVGSLGGWLDIYDFNRCNGVLSNCKSKKFELGGAPGVAVSLNSRYLYVSNGFWLYQYDLLANDIIASETLIGTYDGYLSPLNTYFFLMQLGPDGKIYMNSAATVNTLHVVQRPDLPGTACRFVQHGVQLPTLNNWTIPCFPNYRLRPLDGSPCDTLGLNNTPAAHFRWEFWDTLSPLHVYFTDLSAYEPAEWHWDFGDGSEGTDKDPEHNYASVGVYPVCLSVQNAYGADTICYDVSVGSITEKIDFGDKDIKASVIPNPFNSTLALTVPVDAWQRMEARLFNTNGQLMAHRIWRGAYTDWDLAWLPSGVYFYELLCEDGRRGIGKVLKL